VELKKSLGQHFLHDQNMLQKIADAIGDLAQYASVLEIGPGHGALTRYMLGKKLSDFKAVEIDRRCIDFLKNEYPQLTVINQDFLKTDLSEISKCSGLCGWKFSIQYIVTNRFQNH
jgi:16S rRNA (adenine1518-N6/adenine1519-N6)-dimethyltransferase